MIEESLFITNRFFEKLEALLRKPKTGDKFPAVLFVSGFSMDLHEYNNSNDEISEELVKNGFLTLQFSFADRGKSDGNYREMTLERQAQQVEDVLLWLSEMVKVDSNSIGIHATSFGCPTSLLVNSPLVKSFCLVSGVYFLDERFEKSLQADSVSTTVNELGETTFRDENDVTTTVGPQFWVTNKEFHPLHTAKQVKKPVLMIHGNRDMYSIPAEAKKVFIAFAAKNKHFKLFTGGDHGITDVPHQMREEFIRSVVEWFKSTL